MRKPKIFAYEGEEVLVEYEARRCIHAEECVKGLPGVFERDRRPWIDPDQASAAEIIEVVGRCPTGALRANSREGALEGASPATNTLQVLPNGPLYVEGKLELTETDGDLRKEYRIALCRCGESRNKPFCDKSHVEAGFTDDGSLGDATLTPAEGGDVDPLVLSTVNNGPVLFRGPLEIRGSDREVCQSGGKGALCRCGASANKPYCDGSHVGAGFVAD